MKKKEIIQKAKELGMKGEILDILIKFSKSKRKLLSRRKYVMELYVGGFEHGMGKKELLTLLHLKNGRYMESFIYAWESGLRDGNLKRLLSLESPRHMDAFVRAWKSGLRDDNLNRVLNLKCPDCMNAFLYAWESGIRDKDLDDIEKIIIEHRGSANVVFYIMGWKEGMRGKELEFFFKHSDIHYNHIYDDIYDYDDGTWEIDKEILDMMRLYIYAWNHGMRGEILEILLSLHSSELMRVFINGWSDNIEEEQLRKLSIYLKDDIIGL